MLKSLGITVTLLFVFVPTVVLSETGDIILEDKPSLTSTIQRDPFYRVLEQYGLTDADRVRLATDFELRDFKLIGLVWDVASPIAIFRGPKKKRYILKVGDKIGRQGGVIVKIRQGQLYIQEAFVDINGNRMERSIIKRVES
ncbi:unnamed protein product [marine sediment metagenome]|uniref:Pilus assembly protein PilP n=1 Tax=marine sediment metagenome TaxID=412755 RepID=X0U4Q9_9ZZZZ